MRRGPIHYGWWVLAASVVLELFGLGFGIFAITTVYPFVIDTFPDWPRLTIFAPTSIVIVVAGAMAPLTGAFIDRYPIRVLFVAGITVQSLALLLFGRVQTPAQYLGSAALLGLGLSGVTILPNQVLVARWFHQRVGLVNGILLAATALGAALAPPLITRLIEATDWRAAFGWIAACAFVAPMAVVLGVIRDRPAAVGLAPYGEVPRAEPAGGARLGEAVRSRNFWALGAAVFLGGMPCYSFNKHILVFLKELGWAAVAAADMKGLFFAISACARLSFGWLSDRFDRRRVTIAHLALIALGYPLLLLVPAHPGLLLPCLLVVGVGYGGLLPSIPILAVTYFGRRHLGAILGVYKIPYDLAAAGAPLLTAWLYDLSGGYGLPERVNSGLAWAGLLIAVLALGRTPAAR
jgi:MFS family permease